MPSPWLPPPVEIIREIAPLSLVVSVCIAGHFQASNLHRRAIHPSAGDDPVSRGDDGSAAAKMTIRSAGADGFK